MIVMHRFAPVPLTALALVLSGCGIMEQLAVESQVERLNEAASAENAKVKIAFDPDHETIITDSAPFLVRDYQLNAAHREDETNVGQPDQFTSFRMVSYPGCRRPRAPGDFSYSISGTEKPDICSLEIFADRPPPTALTTKVERHGVEIDGRKIGRFDLIIRRPDGRKATLIFFTAQSPLADLTAAPQIASVLGLPPRGSNGSGLPGPKEVDRLIEAAEARSGRYNYAWLDELAQRNPPSGSGSGPASFAPAEIAKRAEALTRRFELMAPETVRTGYWKIIGDLLAQLPQDDWIRYRDRLAAAMLRAPREDVVTQKKLIHRMADMGASVGPVLARATIDGFVHREIAIAACRAGAPVASAFGKTLLADWKNSNSPHLVGYKEQGWRTEMRSTLYRKEWERCTEDGKKNGPPANIALSLCWAIPDASPDASPTYLALRRMGLGAEADATMRHRYSKHWKKNHASVGPTSPASVCGESNEM